MACICIGCQLCAHMRGATRLRIQPLLHLVHRMNAVVHQHNSQRLTGRKPLSMARRGKCADSTSHLAACALLTVHLPFALLLTISDVRTPP